MIRLIQFIIILTISCASFGQETLFDQLKTGSFYVLNNADTCFIERTEKRQTERCNGSENTYEFIVVWLSEDKYILRDINYNPTTAKRVMRNDLVMLIQEVGEGYHKVYMKAKGRPNKEFTVYTNEQAR